MNMPKELFRFDIEAQIRKDMPEFLMETEGLTEKEAMKETEMIMELSKEKVKFCKQELEDITCDFISKVNMDNKYIKWIPVTERLPQKPEYDWVLGRIEFKDGRKGVPHVVELRDGIWYSANLDLPMEDCLGIKVTHWKPIPDEEVK